MSARFPFTIEYRPLDGSADWVTDQVGYPTAENAARAVATLNAMPERTLEFRLPPTTE